MSAESHQSVKANYAGIVCSLSREHNGFRIVEAQAAIEGNQLIVPVMGLLGRTQSAHGLLGGAQGAKNGPYQSQVTQSEAHSAQMRHLQSVPFISIAHSAYRHFA